LDEHQKKAILHGGVEEASFIWKRHKLRRKWEGVIKIAVCNSCQGYRLSKESLSVKVANSNIADILDLPIEDAYSFFIDKEKFKYLSALQKEISEPILKEIKERLFFLKDVGLGYITLGRDARSISGGEAQRIRIASQIGSGLSGVMYVLDEPSIGLHERDTIKLIKTLKSLQKKGNSVIVVEQKDRL